PRRRSRSHGQACGALDKRSSTARELLAARDTGKLDAKVNAWFGASLHSHSDKPDVVGIGQYAHGTSAVKRYVELARQTKKIAVIENVIMQRLGEWTCIDEFCGIEPCCGRGGNVANIVHTGAARG